MASAEHELDVLEHITRSPETVHQRDLARTAGLSLGMTNAILKRLAQKGLLIIRKINNRNIRYVVSPAGIEAIARRSYSFFRRTVASIRQCRLVIEAYVCELRSLGFDEIRLVGHSDLDFIIENSCRMAGITFSRAEDGAAPACNERGLFTMYSENDGRNPADLRQQGHAVFLQEIVRGTWKGDGRA